MSTACCTRFIVFAIYCGSFSVNVIALFGQIETHLPQPRQFSLRTAFWLMIFIPSRIVHQSSQLHTRLKDRIFPPLQEGILRRRHLFQEIERSGGKKMRWTDLLSVHLISGRRRKDWVSSFLAWMIVYLWIISQPLTDDILPLLQEGTRQHLLRLSRKSC